jgi:hypothetical protein
MNPTVTAFWVDRDYDRAHASDDVSRYGAYLRDAAFEPWTDNDQAVEWAAFAWRRATGPVMSPGYARYHPRVLAAQLERSSWDGSLAAAVALISSWPEDIKTPLTRGLKLGDWEAYCRTGRSNVSATPSVITSPAKRMSLPGRTCWPPSTCSSRCRRPRFRSRPPLRLPCWARGNRRWPWWWPSLTGSSTRSWLPASAPRPARRGGPSDGG